MKRIIFLALTLLMLSTSIKADSISERHVTKEAKACLNKLYPKAVDVKWEDKVKKGYYKVQFYSGNEKVKMEISTKGEVLNSKQTTYSASVTDTPKFVKSYVDKNYPNATIIFTKKEVRSDKTVYVAKITYDNNYGNRRYRTFVFSENGSLIKG